MLNLKKISRLIFILIVLIIGFLISKFIHINYFKLSDILESNFTNQNFETKPKTSNQEEYKNLALENSTKKNIANLKSIEFCDSGNQCYLSMKYPHNYNTGIAKDLKITSEVHTKLNFYDTNEAKGFNMYIFNELDINSLIKQVLTNYSYKTAVITDSTVGNLWARKINLDGLNNFSFFFIKDKIGMISSSDLSLEALNGIYSEVQYNTSFYPHLYISNINHSNLREIKIQQADLDGDSNLETIMSFLSDDDLSKGEKVTRAHLKVLDDKYNIIKKDSTNYLGSNALRFTKIEVVDFGKDGKQELFVQKISTFSEGSSKYYVFGFLNDNYSDYPIKKAYLNEDSYTKCKQSSEGINVAGLKYVNFKITENGILEKYKLRDCQDQLFDLEILQKFEAEKFTNQLINLTPLNEINDQSLNVIDSYLSEGDKLSILEKLSTLGIDLNFTTIDFSLSYENNQNLEIYIKQIRECGGCIKILPHYIRVNKANGMFEFNTLDVTKINKLFKNGTLASSIFSPDESRLFFQFKDDLDNDQLWMYDFNTKTEQRVLLLDDNTGIPLNGGAGGIIEESYYWLDGKNLEITPSKKY